MMRTTFSSGCAARCVAKIAAAGTVALVLAAAWSLQAEAAEQEDVCLYRLQGTSWSAGQAVKGVVLSGEELNTRDGGLARFKPLTIYVAVLWKRDDVSVFELPGNTFGAVPTVSIEVSDQSGAVWRILKSKVCP
jgi:hypothetical protein